MFSGIRGRFLILASLLLLSIVAVFTFAMSRLQRAGAHRIIEEQGVLLRRVMEEETARSGRLLATVLAGKLSDPTRDLDIAEIREMLVAASAEPRVSLLQVLDKNGIVLAENGDNLQQGQPLPANTLRFALDATDKVVVRDTAEMSEFYAPIVFANRRVGVLRMGWSLGESRHAMAKLGAESRANIEAVFAKARGYSVFVATLVVCGLLAMVHWSFRRVVEPVNRLVKETERIAQGDWRQIAAESGDEFERLAEAFNRMTAELESKTVHRNYLNGILAGIMSPVLVADAEGRITQVNPEAERLTGWLVTELIGRDIHSLVEGVYPPVLDAAPLRNVESRLFTRRAESIPVLVSATPMRSAEGICLGYVCVAQDITARIELEEELTRAKAGAESANRAKSEFLANMSHEIRTPMNGVLGMTELVLGTELTEEQRDYVQTARSSAESLLSVINDILDFSKIEAGKLGLENLPFSLEACLAGVAGSFSAEVQRKGLMLLCDLPAGLPDNYVGDQGRLRQVLVNLIGNAIKFTPQGTVSISVRREGPLLRFSVEDTGIGIPLERQRDVFEAFSQADTSITRRFGGTGLGLTISARIAGLMGGRLWLDESAEGKGTRFCFTVRLQQPHESSAVPVLPAELLGARVAITDPVPRRREYIAGLFRDWGMEPVTGDGPEARIVAGSRVIAVSSLGDQSAQPGVAAVLRNPVLRSDLHRAVRLHRQPDASRPPLAEDPSSTGAPLRVLVADDNDVSRTVVCRLLEKQGHRVDAVSSGTDAVRLASNGGYDLLVFDVQMPGLDGLEAAALIREYEQAPGRAGRPVPIIALTAHALPSDRDRCLAAGMDGYLAKPVSAALLQMEMHRVMCSTRERSASSPGASVQTLPAAASPER